MKIQHIIYLIFPFGAGLFIKQMIFKTSDFSYLGCVGVACIISMVVYNKIILPILENQYNTHSSLKKTNELYGKFGIDEIDISQSMENILEDDDRKQYEIKIYSNILWFHFALLVGLIIYYFNT